MCIRDRKIEASILNKIIVYKSGCRDEVVKGDMYEAGCSAEHVVVSFDGKRGRLVIGKLEALRPLVRDTTKLSRLMVKFVDH